MRVLKLTFVSVVLASTMFTAQAHACRGVGEETLFYTSKEPIANLPVGTEEYRVKLLPSTKEREHYKQAFLQVYQPDEPRTSGNMLAIQLPTYITSCQRIKPIAQEGTFYIAGYTVLAQDGKPNQIFGNIHIIPALLGKHDGWLP